ncbi:hypothetical protein PDESU_05881 [Pontiella desulfatans]|uniref:DUF6242 domain-containing protein n=1 Tax=Pontiella desulfatans TaxID=2750659 RepID=A0A6C2UB72_PONDE|nr:hypothetical protein [Pontiella desulfatans]VGO17285.1 hypothetical protein PDESU_05881 [Pontiella desulfatans]
MNKTWQISRQRQQKACVPSAIVIGCLLALLSRPVSAEVRDERWRWSNPLPHGNNVMDMKVSTDLSVQVGDGGSLYVQRSDGRWAPANTGTENYLRSTALLGDRIIATGESGTILWSDDGVDFEQASLSPALVYDDWFEGVTVSGQRAVAVGDWGMIYTSTNGSSWTSATSNTEEWLRGVAAGNGGFVAVGENGTILRASQAAASWSLKTSNTPEHLNRVRFLGTSGSGQFYAVGNKGTLLNSADGISWSSMASGSTNDLYDVAMNNAGLLLVGDQEMRTSIDGGASWVDQINDLPTNTPPAWVYLSAHGKANSWLVAGRTGLLMEGASTNGIDWAWQPSPDDSSHAWLWDMTVQNGIYIAVGDLAHIKTSLDGILWDQEVVPVSHTNTVLLGVGGTSNLLVAVGNAGNVLVSQAGLQELSVTNGAVATNIVAQTYGVVWTNLASFTTNSLQGVAATDGLFIVTGEAGIVFTSPDGTNWTERATPTANFLSSGAIGSGVCVAVGNEGTLIRSTTDGASWSAIPMATTDWLYRVRWIENQFVVVGENGTIFTSPDGSTWTPRASGSTRWLTDVAYADGQWFVSGYQGTLLTSTNLADWSELPLPTGKSLFSAATKDGQLVLAGIEGVTLRNRIVPQTTPVLLLDYSQSIAVDTNAVDTVYELFLFGGEPDQFFDFQSSTNLTGSWTNLNGTLEMYDASGTLYAIRTRDATNAPAAEFYRTELVD